MNGVREILRRIGGPNSITWPAFWVSLLYNEFVHFAGNPTNTAAIPQRVVLVMVSQLGMFAVLLAAKATYLRNTAVRPRPGLTLLTFAASGAVRGVINAYGLVALGAATELQLGYRVIAGIISVPVILSLCAIVVDGIREHQRRLRDLLTARRALDEARAQTLTGIEDRQEEVARRVQASLLTELAALDPDRPEASVALLQHTATDVVRPLSHDLAATVPSWKPRPLTKKELRLDWGEVLRDATYDRPFRPWGIGLCLVGFSFVFLLTFFGALAALLTGIAIILVCAAWFGLMNRVLAGVLPRLGLWPRIVLITAASIVGGIVVGGAQFIASGRTAVSAVTWASSVVFVVLFAWLLTISTAVERQRDRLQEALERDESELRWQLARIHQVQWFQQKALSRALHGPVQSAVTSAAIRLDAAVRDGTSSPDLVEQLQRQIAGSIAVLDTTHDSVAPIEESVELLARSWDGVCQIEGRVDENAAALLGGDDIARACAADFMTEAISNAVRHGRARHVTVSMLASQRAVEMQVVDDGTTPIGEGRGGLGSQILEDCSLEWSRTGDGSGHYLRVVLPVEA